MPLAFDDLPDESATPPAASLHFDSLPDESKPPPQSALQAATAPITSIPSTYSRMVSDSLGQIGRGIKQIEGPSLSGEVTGENQDLYSGNRAWDVTKGLGNVALGGLGYVTSPINAPLHTIVGEPVEKATGSPLAGSLAEAGAGFALPVPKGLPRMGAEAALPAESEFGVTLSGGEQAGNMAMRQAEQKAIRSGEAPEWVAQRQAQLDEANQKLIQGLDPFGQDIAESAGQAPGDLVSQAVQKSAASQKAAVKSAYDTAKALPGEIHAGVFEGMPQGIKGDLTLGDNPVIIDQGTTPNAAKMIDYLDKQISNLKIQNKADPFGPPNPETVTGVNLSGIDQWRKNLSSMRKDAFGSSPPGQTSADARAAQAVLNNFDNRIDAAVNGGMFTGDKSAIAAWNNARAANADYQSTFGIRKGDPVSRVVQKIIGNNVNDPLTPGKVMDQLVGASRTAPSTLNIGVANRLKNILGEQSPEWIAAKQGLLRSLVEPGEGEAALGTGQVATRLSKFLNSDMAGVIYTPAEQATLRAYANLNRQITMPAGTYFPSAPPIQAAMAAMRARVGGIVGALIGHTLVPIPLVGELGGLAAGTQTEKALERLHSGVSKQLPIVGDQMAKWSRAQSAASAQPMNPILQRGAVGATVNLQKALSPLGIDLKQITGAQGPGTASAGQNQPNVPGPVGQQKGGRVEGQQRATGGKVGADSEHKGPVESKSDDKSRAKRANGGRVIPSNIEHDPSQAQKEAGNYAKDHVRVHGLDITIENAKGHQRRGVGPDGKPWAVKMPAHYGYIKGTMGKDKDHVDVYLGPHLKAPNVWVLDQMNAESKKFDEHKTFLGFASKDQVVDTYRKAFSDGKAMDRLGHLTRMTVPVFKQWLESGNMDKKANDHFADAIKIDASHDGPWMSCMSIDGKTMYRNKNIPTTANIKGKAVDVNDMLLHHEVPERDDLEKLLAQFKERFHREPNKNERKAIYLKAHNRSGTPNERAYAKKIDVDWKAWSAWCRGEESKIEKMKFTNEPKDADVKPIPHSHGDLEAVGSREAA
jgi:Inorganic Pyrophosphatase